MIDWNVLIGEAITQMLRIFLPVCVALILKWASELYLKIKEAKPDLAKFIDIAAELGYAAAEDFFRNYKDTDGEEKMQYAIQRAEAYLKETCGVSVDLCVIRDAITQYGVSYYKFSWAQGVEDDSNANSES